ncbi:hypothetical protein ACRALDRAFT_1063613 [Sodiomyces alcalophilus JCM 7366]|uniref:uncharacterized protein n=1 Tax=Sodiomyces alcalophilus JCM 7366 TaxID=591952 RepID=UPI0039B4528B
MSIQSTLADYFSGVPRAPLNRQPRESDSSSPYNRPSSPISSSSQPSQSDQEPPRETGGREGERGRWRRRGGRGGRGRGNDRRRGSNTRNDSHPVSRRGTAELAAVSKETRTVLPGILAQLPNISATVSECLYLDTLPRLLPQNCPRHGPTTIRIVNADTINAALDLAAAQNGTSCARVAILNLASNRSPGGGWRKGSLAQEEALCYRSSLYLSLHQRHYPFDSPLMGLYTPDMLVIRSDMPSGHKLLVPDVAVSDLPVLSCLTVAALRRPEVREVQVQTAAAGQTATERRVVFARPQDRETTKGKMRLCLRMAASRGHGSLVLGALGCGAFGNPPREVALCWREVLGEAEFAGGWWEAIVFAVLDLKREGNFDVFEDVLGGMQV